MTSGYFLTQTFIKHNRKTATCSWKSPDTHSRSQMTPGCAHVCSHTAHAGKGDAIALLSRRRKVFLQSGCTPSCSCSATSRTWEIVMQICKSLKPTKNKKHLRTHTHTKAFQFIKVYSTLQMEGKHWYGHCVSWANSHKRTGHGLETDHRTGFSAQLCTNVMK